MPSKRDKERHLQRRMNGKTLKTLKANGSLLDRPHTITNAFHVLDLMVLAAFCQRLRDNGLHLVDDGSRQVDHGQEYWLVEAQMAVIPSQTTVDAMTDSCVEMTSGLSVDYDGWYTEVVDR